MIANSIPVIASASEAIQSGIRGGLDCFVASAPRNDEASFRGGREASEPGISRHNLELPDRTALRSVRNDSKT